MQYTANDLLERAIWENPDQPAVEDDSLILTWKEFGERVNQVAVALMAAKVKKGDRVAILMKNDAEHVVAMMGVLRMGGVFVNIHPKLKRRQIEHIVSDAKLSAVIVIPERISEFSDVKVPVLQMDQMKLGVMTVSVAWPRIIDRDLACLIYTSGSTGHPKGVVFRQGDIVMCARIMADIFEHEQTDRTLCNLAFSADHGLTLWYITLLKGATLVLKNAFLPQDIADTLEEKKITAYSGVAPIWSALYGSRSDFGKREFPHLRHLSVGGGYPPLKVVRQMIKQFKGKTKIYMLYGLTEANWTSYMPPEKLEDHLGSMGLPLPNVDVEIVDRQGRPVGLGQEGELIHRGGVVAAGYWNNPEKTKQVFRIRNGERVVYSGDLVTRDKEGFMYFKSRKDYQIKVQGFRVATQDVLDCIMETNKVDEVCIFSVPDEKTEQRIVVCISAKKGESDIEDSIWQYLRRELPSYMVPAQVYVLKDMPYTHSAKINVSLLKDMYMANKLESASNGDRLKKAS